MSFPISIKKDLWTDAVCVRCPRLVQCRTQIVLATPCPVGGILAVGEAPGADEDVKGEGFIGMAGRTLDRLFLAQGWARADYARANICRCRPPENKKPTSAEMSACMPFLANLIETTKPKVIIAVGGTPASILCGQGSLYPKIEKALHSNDWSAASVLPFSHPGIKSSLNHVSFIVPMPHTSPLAFNRNAPSGEKWCLIAERQIALAVHLHANG